MTAQFLSRTLLRFLCSAAFPSSMTVCASGLVLAALLVTGCAGAPVQEMSDARQAIRAAQDAGAAQYAPQPLSEAQTLISQAEMALHRQEFRIARRKANAAHEKAAEALHVVEAR